jgi:hypothetical protein
MKFLSNFYKSKEVLGHVQCIALGVLERAFPA